MTNVTNDTNCTLQNNFISTIIIGYILHINMILKGSKKATFLGLRALYTNVYKKTFYKNVHNTYLQFNFGLSSRPCKLQVSVYEIERKTFLMMFQNNIIL